MGLADHLVTVAATRATPRVVAIDGPSGAGKTTFADVVAAAITDRSGSLPQIVHMDDLFPGWDGLAAAVPLLVEQVLTPLAEGRDGAFRRWDWLAEDWAETIPVPAAEWVVVEGVGCGSRACRPTLAALAWVEADPDVRMARGIERDGEAYRPHWERWARQEQALFAAEDTRSHADVILRT